MARGDAFLAKDLSKEIALEAESTETLETTAKEAGGLKVLTVRLGPNKREVKVVREGKTLGALRPDVTQILADYRGELTKKNLMTAADQFWKGGGPILDEDDFSIENALHEGSLTIGPAAGETSQTRQTIVVAKGVKPENLKFVEVDGAQNVGQLRTKLETEKFMAPSDAFVGGDGASLSKAQEAGLVKDAVGANKPLTIVSGSQTIVVAKGVKPENLKFVEVDGAQNLGQLRTKLETEKFMAPSDAFGGGDGASLSKAQEAGLVKDAVGANKPLTIVSGSQTIVVAKGVKPENFKFVEVDGAQNLGQLRAKLETEKFMAPTDAFAGGDGASLSKAQEAGLVKDAVGANKPLAIVSGSRTIVIAKGVKPENLKFLEVDVSQTLAQLRAKLAADSKFMTSDDTFIGGDGKAISNEAGLVKDAVGADKPLTITSGWT